MLTRVFANRRTAADQAGAPDFGALTARFEFEEGTGTSSANLEGGDDALHTGTINWVSGMYQSWANEVPTPLSNLDYIALRPSNIDITGAFAFCALVKIQAGITGTQVLIAYAGANTDDNNWFQLRLTNGQLFWYSRNNSGATVAINGTTTGLVAGTTYHIGASHAANGDTTIFLDGVADAAAVNAPTAAMLQTHTRFNFGLLDRASRIYAPGIIDSFRCANREMTAQEMAYYSSLRN